MEGNNIGPLSGDRPAEAGLSRSVAFFSALPVMISLSSAVPWYGGTIGGEARGNDVRLVGQAIDQRFVQASVEDHS
jgi:hypothetical protein